MQECFAASVRPSHLAGPQALAIGPERGAEIGRKEAIHDRFRGTDILVATGLQLVGDIGSAGFLHRLRHLVAAAPSRCDVSTSTPSQDAHLGVAREKMVTMAARIEPKITVRTFDRTRRNGGTTVRGQRPGTRDFRSAERAAQAVCAIQPARSRLVGQQLNSLLGRECLNSGSPPVARGCYGS